VSGRPHISAEDVTRVAGIEIGAISRQAVYDALGVLADRGLIRRIQPVGSPARYEDRVDDNHHHLICRDCGRLVDVDCAVGAAPCLTASDDNGYEIDEADVAYWGICPQCQAEGHTASRFDSSTVDRLSQRRTPALKSSSPQSKPESDGTHDRY
jgi:Fe2+ or Zn2+ uptake regulation protein